MANFGDKLENPSIILPDGRRWKTHELFPEPNVPNIRELRPVLHEPKGRVYAFTPEGEGVFVKEFDPKYGNNAWNFIIQYWGKPSPMTWGHTARPVPSDYDDIMLNMIADGAEKIEQVNEVSCIDGCCEPPTIAPREKWRLSEIKEDGYDGKAIITSSDGSDSVVSSEVHKLYKAPSVGTVAAEHEVFISLVETFGEPFDYTNGNINPVYQDVFIDYMS